LNVSAAILYVIRCLTGSQWSDLYLTYNVFGGTLNLAQQQQQ